MLHSTHPNYNRSWAGEGDAQDLAGTFSPPHPRPDQLPCRIAPTRRCFMTEPLRVLVVDDCPDTRASLQRLLRLWGHNTREAADGPAALVAAEDFLPQAVLLDLSMPVM